MADPETTPDPEPTPDTAAPPAPKRRAPRAKPKADADPKEPAVPTEESDSASKKSEDVTVPRRAKVDGTTRHLLALRRSQDDRRPIFGRQAANRYYRIGRDGAWRRPRGLQSKQRRHYGYRAKIVRVGYRSPAAVRGLVPSGFRPVIVRTRDDLEGINAEREAAVIARTVGTRRRLVLEEEAQKLGIRVLNPIVKAESEA